MGQYCTTERDGHLLIVTINRPERMNALHPPANAELAQVFDDFAADPELWVAIITGAGQGIGFGYAQRFLQEGATVVVAEINDERAADAMRRLEGVGEVIAIRTDVSDPESAQACADAKIGRAHV